MAKLKFWLIPLILGLTVGLAYSSGWAAGTYSVSMKKDIYISSDPNTEVLVPIGINTTSQLESFDLVVQFNPTVLRFNNEGGDALPDFKEAYDIEGGQQPDASDMVFVSGMLKADRVRKQEVLVPLLTGQVGLLSFKVKAGVSSPTTKITVFGCPDKNNPLKDVTSSTTTIHLTNRISIPVNVLGVSSGEAFSVKLMKAGSLVDKIDGVSVGPDVDNVVNFYEPANTGLYKVMAQANGYKSASSAGFEVGNEPSQIDLTLLGLKLVNVRGGVVNHDSSNYLKLDFSYVYKGSPENWPESEVLTLTFFEDANFATQKGAPFKFSRSAGVTSGSVHSIKISEHDAYFDANYISLEVEPSYVSSEHVFFKTEFGDVNPFKKTFEVSAVAQKKTEDNFESYEAPPLPVSDMSSVSTKVKGGKVKVTEGGVLVEKPVDMTVSMPNLTPSFIKDNKDASVDPNTELKLKIESKTKDPNSSSPITVVSIHFVDPNTGNEYEYNPDPNSRAEAEPVVIDLPLHEDLQSGAYNESQLEDILLDVNNGKYGIYFESLNGVPRRFIPNGDYGESLTVHSISGLYYAHIVTKHTSTWYSQPVPSTTCATSSNGSADHWYECFIDTICPRFLFR